MSAPREWRVVLYGSNGIAQEGSLKRFQSREHAEEHRIALIRKVYGTERADDIRVQSRVVTPWEDEA